MTRPDVDGERLLEAALDAARGVGDPGLDAAASRAVLSRVQAELAGPPRRAWAPAAGVGLAAAAAAALALVLWQRSGVAPVAPEPAATEPPARIVFRGGAVEPLAADDTEVAREAPLVLAEAARVDLELPAVAQVAVFGPARVVARRSGGVSLVDGRASFSVKKRHPTDDFVVAAGDLDVVVHGTRFDVVVRDGRLSSVEVSEGRVEVRPRDGGTSTFLDGGMRYGAPEAHAPAVFDAPWWGSARAAEADQGYLLVSSAPSGARVTLGGDVIGTTPLIVRWPTGEHAVALALEGHAAWSGAAVIPARGIARVSAALVSSAASGAAPPTPAAAPRRSPPADLWRSARALLEARRCQPLEALVERMVRQSDEPADRARAEMMAAECHLRASDRRGALRRFQRVRDTYPDTPSAETALYELASLEAALDRRRDSLASLEAYLDRYPRGHFAEAATARRCELLARMGALAPARACLEDYRTRYPDALRASHALLLLATIARAEGRWADAAPLYAAYLERSPSGTNAELAERQRIECLRWGKLPGVAEAIDAYLARYPSGAHSEEVRAWRR